jgi:hypothetical protein
MSPLGKIWVATESGVDILAHTTAADGGDMYGMVAGRTDRPNARA